MASSGAVNAFPPSPNAFEAVYCEANEFNVALKSSPANFPSLPC